MPRAQPLLGVNPIDQKLSRMLRGYMGAERVTQKELAATMKISLSTLHRKKNSPSEFTLRELERACKKLHIPMTELCECLMASGK